ncbi:hypothetical protein F5Y13DRAFT_164535 [Hypoxylon sp. FL1857]|nr:hypothetical protein F5Y13DRAFT_164535 [Hypoxylon sp. FL1857]
MPCASMWPHYPEQGNRGNRGNWICAFAPLGRRHPELWRLVSFDGGYLTALSADVLLIYAILNLRVRGIFLWLAQLMWVLFAKWIVH